MTGLFVVLEGVDGAGKSTQMALLAERLRKRGLKVTCTREPGGSALGQEIRQLFLHGEFDLDWSAEALLVCADRAQHLADVVKPALERGEVVLSDRYVPSSLVYQGIGRNLSVEWVLKLNDLVTGDLIPDRVIVLDVPLEVSRNRGGSSPDRIESEDVSFKHAIRQGYLDLAKEFGWAVIDGTGEVDEISTAVWRHVEPLV